MSEPKKKAVYVGAPACFALEQACQYLTAAFGNYGCYVVGSALETPDWRDVNNCQLKQAACHSLLSSGDLRAD